MKVKLTLTKSAKGSGGDRYEGYIEGEPKPLVIYLPQHITRKSNTLAVEIDLEITPKW